MPYTTRWEFIEPYVTGKSVLDVGPAELVGSLKRHAMERWIHGKVAAVASRLVGVEISREQIELLAAMGYVIREGNAESFELQEQFDVVLAGEVIEHLSNPGKFLDCAWRHLEPGGQIVLTTPNRFSVTAYYRLIRSGVVAGYDKPLAKHTAYYDGPSLTALLERHGFSQVRIDYCKWVGAPAKGVAGRALVGLSSTFRPVLLPVLLAVATKCK